MCRESCAGVLRGASVPRNRIMDSDGSTPVKRGNALAEAVRLATAQVAFRPHAGY